jgi:hypothetical protein
MSGDEIIPFPTLPNELVHRILRLAAGSSRSDATTLYLVASWVNPIILPQLLSTVVIRSVQQASLFIEYISKHKDAGLYTRGLWMSGVTCDTIVPIIKQCTQLSRLAVTECAFFSLMSTPSFGGGDLQVTIIDERDIFTHYHLFRNNGDPGAHIFQRITHLFLSNPSFYHKVKVTHYYRLTHFAISWDKPEYQFFRELDRMVISLQSLQMMVVVISTDASRIQLKGWTSLEMWVRERRRHDKRIYILDSPGVSKDWYEEAEGGASMWEKAVMFTAACGLLD